mmetsp:Transcript_21249/g.27402  ORF Transcript_21249/g.27402 Transcript_21249/m.27402 type:complete len:670 (+) Transcript_21249:171-2180(+)
MVDERNGRSNPSSSENSDHHVGAVVDAVQVRARESLEHGGEGGIRRSAGVSDVSTPTRSAAGGEEIAPRRSSQSPSSSFMYQRRNGNRRCVEGNRRHSLSSSFRGQLSSSLEECSDRNREDGGRNWLVSNDSAQDLLELAHDSAPATPTNVLNRNAADTLRVRSPPHSWSVTATGWLMDAFMETERNVRSNLSRHSSTSSSLASLMTRSEHGYSSDNGSVHDFRTNSVGNYTTSDSGVRNRSQRAFSDSHVVLSNFLTSLSHPAPIPDLEDGRNISNGDPDIIDLEPRLSELAASSGSINGDSEEGIDHSTRQHHHHFVENGNRHFTNDANNPTTEADRRMERASRWIRVNQCINCAITSIALLFSLLLFTILVCWVVLTSAYVISIDHQCDVPLKPYYWLATLQLILDVFRTDLMRYVFCYDPNAYSRQRLPRRVILYNTVYIAFAMMVLFFGVRSVFYEKDSTCSKTAPELYQTSKVFVCLSIAAWASVVFVYLLPFFFIAVFLTQNGYLPPSTIRERNDVLGGRGALFARSVGAPPDCIDRLRRIKVEEFPNNYPKECCICMVDFQSSDEIVATECDHVFHKQCCQEWLRQACTCPVCRTDIPLSLGMTPEHELSRQSSIEMTSSASLRVPESTGTFSSEGVQLEVMQFFRTLNLDSNNTQGTRGI